MAKKKPDKSDKDTKKKPGKAEGGLFGPAKDYKDDSRAPKPLPEPDSFDEIDKKLSSYDRNDTGNAKRLLARHGESMAFVHEAGWYGWLEKYWSGNEGPFIVQEFGQDAYQSIKREALYIESCGPGANEDPEDFEKRYKGHYKWAIDSGFTPRINGMMKQAEPHVRQAPEKLDAHEFLFNVQNGTLNLDSEETSEDDNPDEFPRVRLEPHTRAHFITKIAGIEYAPEAQAPEFQKFLHEIMADDEMRSFLQRWFGYCLSGSVDEQVIVMLHGGGSNGKSVLTSLMKKVYGTYAELLPFESLLHNDKKKGSDATPDLIGLPGARLVLASEPEVGAKFSASMIKKMTGDGIMKVRGLHKGFVSFMPQFKITLSFNNKPLVRDPTDGMWRRLLLVPFEQRFFTADKMEPGGKLLDPGLERRLEKELPGILNWVLDGYRMWREGGLQVPEKIRAATAAYRAESNPVREFIDDWCELKPDASIQAKRLYDAFVEWNGAGAAGAMSQTTFGYKIKDMGINKERGRTGVVYEGIQLNTAGADIMAEHDRKKTGRKGDDDDSQ